MRFVIVGAGRVGIRTARALRESGHDVALVECDDDRVNRARQADFETVVGDGATEGPLERAGIADADGLAGLTGDLSANFAACLVGDHHGCRTVMRIDEDYREEIYLNYADAVDEVIYPERLGAIAAKNALVGGDSLAIADIAENLQLVEYTVTDRAPIRGYTFDELELPADARVLAYGSGAAPVDLPDGDVTIASGDSLVVLGDFDVLGDVRRLIVGEQRALGGA
ncbi:MAG: potassium channel family protein [Halococcoides sp.]